MTLPVRYTFSLISPFCYLGAETFFDMTQRTGASVILRAVSIGDIFAVTGGGPGKDHPSRQAYRRIDLARWREIRGKSKMNLKPAFFPANDSLAVALVNAAIAEGNNAVPLILALHNLVWEDERDISDERTLQTVGAQSGYDMVRLMDSAKTSEISGLREVYTQEAVETGIFGVPWYQVGNEEFWGQDNLERIAEKLHS